MRKRHVNSRCTSGSSRCNYAAHGCVYLTCIRSNKNYAAAAVVLSLLLRCSWITAITKHDNKRALKETKWVGTGPTGETQGERKEGTSETFGWQPRQPQAKSCYSCALLGDYFQSVPYFFLSISVSVSVSPVSPLPTVIDGHINTLSFC